MTQSMNTDSYCQLMTSRQLSRGSTRQKRRWRRWSLAEDGLCQAISGGAPLHMDDDEAVGKRCAESAEDQHRKDQDDLSHDVIDEALSYRACHGQRAVQLLCQRAELLRGGRGRLQRVGVVADIKRRAARLL